ncbi:bacterio-opsin activator domain-containing protein [Natronoarchaeum sp. GCM10025321]|uniref:bacterio-opsin activator domain-containing protein n=1 Tax=Natronoarchaeum sp. GCM10025321 TaxID=3252684 RepID=UPI00361E4510
MSSARALLVHPDSGADRIEDTLDKAGCQVVRVERATSALAKLSGDQFDCLVSEYELPGDDGVALLSAVREAYPELPVVLFTDSDEQGVTTRAFENGVSRFLRKNGSESLRQLRSEVDDVTSSRGLPVQQQDISDHRPTPEEISRVAHEAPIGMTMSDPSLSGNPLVFVNEAWSELTGYDEEHMLGRNPRILQGPETDPKTVEKLSNAIAEEEPVTVEIRNYRSDGTPFWNQLTVAPIHDDDGEVVHYVGFQNDITDRKTAERLAEERAEKLATERTVLQRVITRVNGLLSEISRILVEENEREIIMQEVCDEIVDSEGYVASWIGTTNPTDTTFQLSASSGTVGDIDSKLAVESMPTVLQDALESGKVESCAAEAEQCSVLDPASVGTRRFAVVPLIYQQKRYGLLGVYADSEDALDSREEQLFASIGQMIASGLNAVETARILSTENVIELEVEIYDRSFPLSAFSEVLGSDVEYVGLTGEDDCEAYIRTPRVEGDRSDLLTLPFVESVRQISETEDGYTLAIEMSSKEPFDRIADYGVSVVNITAEPTRATLSLEVPPKYDVRSVLELLESLYDRVELRSKSERDKREETSREFTSEIDDRLTKRQRTSLKTAHMNGYFEWPREVDGEEVASTLGITRQTFHQHLRAAERKLVEAYIDPN